MRGHEMFNTKEQRIQRASIFISLYSFCQSLPATGPRGSHLPVIQPMIPGPSVAPCTSQVRIHSNLDLSPNTPPKPPLPPPDNLSPPPNPRPSPP